MCHYTWHWWYPPPPLFAKWMWCSESLVKEQANLYMQTFWLSICRRKLSVVRINLTFEEEAARWCSKLELLTRPLSFKKPPLLGGSAIKSSSSATVCLSVCLPDSPLCTLSSRRTRTARESTRSGCRGVCGGGEQHQQQQEQNHAKSINNR